MESILLIEDDKTFSAIIERFLVKKGYHVVVANDLQSGQDLLTSTNFNLLLLDYRLPDGIGLDLLPTLRDKGIVLPVIMLTSFNDVRTAVKSMASGVFDYILKPINPDELLMTINAALASPKISEPSAPISKDSTQEVSFIKGSSEESDKLYKHVALVAPTEMSVMIIGESGTGKEHIAREIHNQSERSNKVFEAVDCGVLSNELAASELFGHVKGAFTGALLDKVGILERANGGTLFLDEIGNLTYDVQVKLLRALQERTIQRVGSSKTISIDIRLITATNENLLEAIAEGQFREDVYHRINEFKIQIPALRNRGEDLDIFISYFISEANKALRKSIKGITPEVQMIFNKYDWPGNLRQLKNIINRMSLLAPTDILNADLLPEEMLIEAKSISNSSDLKLVQEETERVLIQKTMLQCNNNKSKVAKILNIDRKTLYSKLDKYQLS